MATAVAGAAVQAARREASKLKVSNRRLDVDEGSRGADKGDFLYHPQSRNAVLSFPSMLVYLPLTTI